MQEAKIKASMKQELRYGRLTGTCLHICVDMQRLFAEETEWKMSWMKKVLPEVVSLVAAHPERTLFTRFIPAQKPGQGTGMWRRYYERWASMTVENLGSVMIDLVPELADFVPPAKILDKHVYSPWTGSNLHGWLRDAGIDTLLVSGGETDVCVLATVIGAVDWGFRVVIATDALCSSSDRTHNAMMEVYTNRFGEQVEIASVETVLANWNA